LLRSSHRAIIIGDGIDDKMIMKEKTIGPINSPGMKAPSVSIIVPCLNEEATLNETHTRLTSVLSRNPDGYEILYIDDGSSDNTAQLLAKIQESDTHVRVLGFARNFGHQIAVTAGIDHANGDGVILIDADLQDPPELIPEMVELWRQGYDVVYGQREEREGETVFKRLTAKLFYKCINCLSEIPIPLDTGDFRLMDRRVVDVLRHMPESDRFIRGMVSWVGFRQTPIRYKRQARVAGETKYPLTKMVRFALDGMTSFSRVPLKLAGILGLLSCSLAMLGIVYSLVIRLLTDNWEPGWTTLMLVVLFLGGAQLMCLGIIGEYVGRTFMEGKRRPLYVVREKLGFQEDTET